MKILLVGVGHQCDTPGGTPRITHEESEALRDLGHEVWMLARGDGQRPEHEVRDGIHLLRYVPAKFAAWDSRRATAHQRAAAALLRKYLPQVDAIHGHIQLAYVAALDLYGPSVHSVYTIHSPARPEMDVVLRSRGRLQQMLTPFALRRLLALERECIDRSSVVTALSRFTIESIAQEHSPAIAARIELLPGWVDTGRFVPLTERIAARERMGWPTDRTVLFTLRRLEARMGLDRLIAAVAELVGEGMRFQVVIGGSGPMREALEQQVRELGVSDSVRFLGRVPDEVLPVAYGASDAFVLPTLALECFGLIAIESLATGRPVLATRVGAIPEVVSNFEPAWLATGASTAEIAALLRSFLRGSLPTHKPQQLHERTRELYGRDRVLPMWIETLLRK